MATDKQDEVLNKKAVAIKYDKDTDSAPKVVAKGKGIIADKIVAVSKQHSIPVYQNKTLTAMLMAVELDKEIPPELYQAVAEILAYVYRVDQKMSNLFRR